LGFIDRNRAIRSLSEAEAPDGAIAIDKTLFEQLI
jgi:hypothetical protein